MPKHNEDSKTRQVTLRRHVASPQFGSFHTFLASGFPAFTKYGDLGSGLALSFLLSLSFSNCNWGTGDGGGWSGSWQRSHLVSLLPARAAGGV